MPFASHGLTVVDSDSGFGIRAVGFGIWDVNSGMHALWRVTQFAVHGRGPMLSDMMYDKGDMADRHADLIYGSHPFDCGTHMPHHLFSDVWFEWLRGHM